MGRVEQERDQLRIDSWAVREEGNLEGKKRPVGNCSGVANAMGTTPEEGGIVWGPAKMAAAMLSLFSPSFLPFLHL